MNRLKGKYKFYFVLCAIAALWLSIGSLVHFHQYKIYGKPLLSQVVISKRENDIFAKTFDLKKITKGIEQLNMVHPGFITAFFIEQDNSDLLFTWTSVPWKEAPLPFVVAEASAGLRAPPLS